MNGVSLLRLRVQFANRPGLGLRRIGGTDHLSQVCDGVIPLQGERQRRSGSHERDEGPKERALAMHPIERLGARFGQLDHLRFANLEAFSLELGDDLACMPGSNGVRFDDGESQHAHNLSFRSGTTSAGRFMTLMPAFWRDAIFSAAVPDEPEIMAPACPMRRPGGAVWPAMNPTTGFLTFSLTN